MKRILIIGNAGSGKTTFAKKLAEKTALPPVHLDRIFWRGKWNFLSKEEFDPLLQSELEKEEWIIDGNFNRTLPHRIKYCDTVFYFDLPTVLCLWGITKRVFLHYGKTRDDMSGVCPEYFDRQKFKLFKAVIRFNRKYRKKYYRLLEDAENIHVIIFKSRKQIKLYLESLI